MEVDVIDDADKSVDKQASDRCENPLLEGGQEIHEAGNWLPAGALFI